MNRRILLLGGIVLIAVCVVLVPRGADAQPEQICFSTVPDVTNCIQGRFAQFWRENGNLELFGFPVTGEFQETVDGVPRTVQYFERARLEYHPESAPPYDVQLGRVGAQRLEQQGRSWFSFARLSGPPNEQCLFSNITGHAICDELLDYYRSRGIEYDGSAGFSEAESIALFGLPLSEPQIESNSNGVLLLTQWFERARFEYQPANPEGFRVLLGLVGSEVYLGARAAPAPAAPAPTRLAITPRPEDDGETDDDDDDDDDDNDEKFISRQGTITTLERGRGSLTLATDDRAWTVEFNSRTNILHQDRSRASAAELEVGQNLFVRGADRGRFRIRARTIILPGSASAPEPTALPPAPTSTALPPAPTGYPAPLEEQPTPSAEPAPSVATEPSIEPAPSAEPAPSIATEPSVEPAPSAEPPN